MPHPAGIPQPSDVIGDHVRELRRQRGWTAKDLSKQCAKVGATDMTGASILNIETGRRGPDGKRRRDVTVEELLALSRALGVAPMSLMFPITGVVDGNTAIEVTPGTVVADREQLRRWAAGIEPLGKDDDFWDYFRDTDPFEMLKIDEDRFAERIRGVVQEQMVSSADGLLKYGRAVADLAQSLDKEGSGELIAALTEAFEGFASTTKEHAQAFGSPSASDQGSDEADGGD